MPFEVDTSGKRTVVEVSGDFGPDELRALCTLVAAVEPARAVTIDFHEVRLVHDTAVAMLARALARLPNVLVVGLSEHHHRLLRYMGDDVAQIA